MCLRGWNHSRVLFFFKPRKNVMASGGNPPKPGFMQGTSSIMKSMSGTEETLSRLAAVPSLQVSTCVPLSRYTRFGIGGPADIYAETSDVEAFIAAMAIARESGLDFVVIGGGTNLIVADAGFRGVVLRFVAERLMAAGERVVSDAGAVLQDLVDFSIARGLK